MTMSSPTNESPSGDTSSFDFVGKILRKKNISAEYLKLALQREGHEKSTTVYVPRNKDGIAVPSEFNFLHLNAVVSVRGRVNEQSYPHVESCRLVRCAPDARLIREILALPNYASFASTLGYDDDDEGEGELRRAVEEAKSRKEAVNCVVEKLTGRRAKAPPRYRPGRVRRPDMDVLERKEAEGTAREGGDGELTWQLCQPCGPSVGDTPSDDRGKQSVINLPPGSDHTISAHGKLTRSEYLETKKNRQATWFVRRMKRLDKLPTRFLDVGGGRGDLAVQLCVHFPEMRGVVVDSNERSVLAGREHAANCGVDDRVEFLPIDFARYVEQYDGGRRDPVDFVVALHACGDLSDMALSFASSHAECDFIVCPCCYPKRYLAPFVPRWHAFCTEAEVDSLSRLAELDDHGEVSRRAMLVVNSMRRNAFEEAREGRGQEVELEEFDKKISGRNIALVGTTA